MWRDSIKGTHEEAVSLFRRRDNERREAINAKNEHASVLSPNDRSPSRGKRILHMEDLTPRDVTNHVPRPLSQVVSSSRVENKENIGPLQKKLENAGQLQSNVSESTAKLVPESPEICEAVEKAQPVIHETPPDIVRFEKFDEMQSKAAAHWTSGVNVTLEQKETSKAKKSGWLKEEDWFKSQPSTNTEKLTKKQGAANPQPAPYKDSAKTNERKHAATAPTQAAAHNQQHQQSPTPLSPHHITSPKDTFHDHAQSSNSSSVSQNALMIEIPVGIPSSGQMIPVDYNEENMTYQFLYSVNRYLFGAQTLPKFRSEVESLLRRANNFSYRTFGSLISALTFVIRQEQSVNNSSTSSMLLSHLPIVLAGVYPFTQFYAQTPAELMPLLQFLSMLVSIYPESASLIPTPLILSQLEKVKHTFNPQEFEYALMLIRSIPKREMAASSCVSGVSNALGALASSDNQRTDETFTSDDSSHYSDDSQSKVSFFNDGNDVDEAPRDSVSLIPDYVKEYANTVSLPWSQKDLGRYLKTHYTILREELLGPARMAIHTYLESYVPTKTMDNTTKIYTGLRIYSSLTTETNAGPVAVFQVSEESSGKNDSMMNTQHGYTAVLARELQRTSSQISQPSSATRDYLIGTVIHATGHKFQTHAFGRVSSCMIAIHMDQTTFDRVDLLSTYTLVIMRSNAPVLLSVLSWLKNGLRSVSEYSSTRVLAPQLLAVKSSFKESSTNSTFLADYRNDSKKSEAPEYLRRCELDVSCVMVSEKRGCKAQPGLNIWPSLQEKHRSLHPMRRPSLYCLSDSQVNAVRHSLCHRVSAISGASGTGKTHLAKKLVELSYQALVSGHFFHPILVLTHTESALEDILEGLIDTIPDLIMFGNNASTCERLVNRQGEKLVAKLKHEAGRKIYDKLEKQLIDTQTILARLWHLRQIVVDRDPAFIMSTMPEKYAENLRTCPSSDRKRWHKISLKDAWSAWLSDDYSQHSDKRSARNTAYASMIRAVSTRYTNDMTLDHGPSTLHDATTWPFSNQQSDEVIAKWSKVPASALWVLSKSDRKDLVEKVASALLRHFDLEIHRQLSNQWMVSQEMDNSRLQLWTSVCQFSRVIGMTADFAAANSSFVSKLQPRVFIVDQASCILESVITAMALGPRVEHLIMLGDSNSTARPNVMNEGLKGPPFNLDVSLFERWKLSNGEVQILEEQWRMCSEVADVQGSLNVAKTSQKQHNSEVNYDDNFADKTMQPLHGLSHRTFFVDYQTKHSASTIDTEISQMVGVNVTDKQTDEARFVCSLALYLSLQGQKARSVAILTLCPVQLNIVNAIIQEEVSSWSSFADEATPISASMASDWVGKETQTVLISIATPGGQTPQDYEISLALSRARFGLYIIGSPSSVLDSRWNNVANYMSRAGRYSTRIPLKCENHKDHAVSVGFWTDFVKVKNGGCLQPCKTLLECNHVCTETCHHISHSEVVCNNMCERPRSNGCTHPCLKKCYQCARNKDVCPPCREQKSVKLPCGHTKILFCTDMSGEDELICKETVLVTYPCGHQSRSSCGAVNLSDAPHGPCQELVSQKLQCGHTTEAMCGYTPSCIAKCEIKMDCGHQCRDRCGSPHSHDRAQCVDACPKQLICGHNCSKGCNRPNDHTDRCLEKCRYICSHGYKCGRECWKACNQCNYSCPSSCIHASCTKKCHQICDRPPCNLNCLKKLVCSHPCSGLCGEVCPPCKTCESDRKCNISLRTLSEFDAGEKIYMLPECGCVFSVEALDLYFKNQAKNGEHTAVKLWQCPTCQTPIYTALRYSNYIKTEIALVNEIKARQEIARQTISEHEKSDIIYAMNTETKAGIHNIVGGRWFVCENNHPYYIGECGGATEVSNCPHCGAVIGGLQHKVVESNRFYGKFDDSPRPAWPGQPDSFV